MVVITVIMANVWVKERKIMRQQIVKAKSFAQAFEKCPWASEVSKVRGGYMCFESVTEHTER